MRLSRLFGVFLIMCCGGYMPIQQHAVAQELTSPRDVEKARNAIVPSHFHVRSHFQKKRLDRAYRKAAKELDVVARSVERFGSISVSSPYIMQPSNRFSFGLERTGEDYYNDSRIQGAAQIRKFQVFSAQAALSVNLEEVAKALKDFSGAPNPSMLDRLGDALFSFDTAQEVLSGDTGTAITASVPPQYQAVLGIARSVLDRAAQSEADAAAQPPADPPTYESPDMPDFLSPEERSTLAALPDKFTPVLPTFTGDIGISPRERLLLSSNDKMTQDILNWLAFPQVQDLGDNKMVFMCLLTVSCQPGFVTRKGFAAEVTVSVDYGRKPNKTEKKIFAEKLDRPLRKEKEQLQKLLGEAPKQPSSLNEEPDEQKIEKHEQDIEDYEQDKKKYEEKRRTHKEVIKTYEQNERIAKEKKRTYRDTLRTSLQEGRGVHPLVVAAYPMFDGQVLDLRSSLREQRDFALQLAASGFGLAGKAMADFVKRLEQDVQTQSVVTVGNTTSFGGATFGFRIEPRLVALGDPSNKKGKPEMKLDAKTFPALILLVLDKDDLTYKVSGREKVQDKKSEAEGLYDHLVMHVETKWSPLKGSGFFQKEARLSEQALMKRASALDKSYERFNKVVPLLDKIDGRQAFVGRDRLQTLSRRHLTLRAMGVGTSVWQALPTFEKKTSTPIGKPHINDNALDGVKGWLNGPSVFLIPGKHLAGRVVAVTVAGLPAEILELSDGAIVVAFAGWPAKSDQALQAPVLVATTTGVLPAGTVSLEYKADVPTSPEADPAVVVTRDDGGNVTGLKLIGEFKSHTSELAAQLKEILSKGGSGKFQMQFKGESSADVSMSN